MLHGFVSRTRAAGGAVRQVGGRALLVLFALSALPAGAAPPKERIADAWYAHNAVLMMLGAADRVVATVARPDALPWMFRVAPGLARARHIDGATMNAETLLRARADVVFVTPADPSAAALRRAGLDVVPVGFTDFASMLQCIDLSAATLDTPLASQRAQAYRAYLDAAVVRQDALAARTPIARRPRVLHIASVEPLKIDGSETIVDQWIRTAGGRNAATGLKGNLQPVSIEQVVAWAPDVIILAANAGRLETSRQAALWNSLDAVRRHRVYRNPAGVFPWDRYGPELALQLPWAAGIISGAPVPEADMVRRTRDFYARFFAYALSPADARRMLAGLPPA
ncbi:ABC transporter substrate-binding protein [Robbsia sp. Bb-Pol-6]|uniref:ABC transporter substrate-binding protein n=1 Tax=Robbsia betulipollinis TaxID=2981849 RepID=A0ABT3ZSS7_9BURK|nr:ABC transporter substrate-binding protein [Robbsia betulipollinis]MCY0389280.1 ABC transporter substrate-binding protein [Robbsia betulipollinis]